MTTFLTCLVIYLGMFSLIACVGIKSGPNDPKQYEWRIPWMVLLYPLVFIYVLVMIPKDWRDSRRLRKEHHANH